MVIHTFSRSQSCVSLSSGESEYIACVSATCDGIFLRSALQRVLRTDVSMHLFTDSSAARGIMGRQGCGRLRPVQMEESIAPRGADLDKFEDCGAVSRQRSFFVL